MSVTPLNDPEQNGGRLDRRRFLYLLSQTALWLTGGIGLVGILRFLSFPTDPPRPHRFTLNLPEEYAPGSVVGVPQARAILYRDLVGFYALSTVCPHLGCTVEQANDGFQCPCHGSQFTLQGQVINGPAETDLSPVLVEKDQDGRLVIDTQQSVAIETRLPF
jgi:cytochrome b6-f complex iron-sulfur subunit